MSLFKWLRTPLIYIRKELLYTSFAYRTVVEAEGSVNETGGRNKSKKPTREEVSVDVSIEYLKSEAYKKAYKGEPVWTYYRRNFKGQLPPETRRNCVKNGVIANASPCPICRDEYLTVHYKNIDLLKQFISPYGGEILPTKKTGVCQFQFRKLLVEIAKARDYGMLTFDVPHRPYNYDLYKKAVTEDNSEISLEEESILTEK